MAEGRALRRYYRAFGAVLAASALALSACSGGPRTVGDLVGEHRDFGIDATVEPMTYVWIGDDIATLAETLDDLGLSDIAVSVAQLNPDTHLAVSVHYDACAKAGPAPTFDGTSLKVTFADHEDHVCVRAVDAVAIFALKHSDVPADWTVDICTGQLTIRDSEVTGAPIGMC